MRKLFLGIFVLGLLLSSIAIADTGKYLCITNDTYVTPYHVISKFNDGEKPKKKSCLYKIFENKNTNIYNKLVDEMIIQKKDFKHLITQIKNIEPSTTEKNFVKKEKKETTKKVEKKTTITSISPKLKLIEDMYKSGALTKNEYEAAKKRATE